MKISFNGKGENRENMLYNLVQQYEAKVVKTTIENPNFPVVDYTSESFKYVNDDENVIFDGGVFDGYIYFNDEGKSDLQEQIILSYLSNVDKVVILVDDMSTEDIKVIYEYRDMFPDKIKLYSYHNSNN